MLKYAPTIGFFHHKCGTVLMKNLLRDFSFVNKLGYDLEQIGQIESEGVVLCDDRVNMFWNSEYNVDFFDQLGKGGWRGVHVIRDPREVVVSSCLYHRRYDGPGEEWMKLPLEKFYGKTYQEVVRSLDVYEALFVEMEHASNYVIKNLLGWNYENPNILELKYENIIMEFDETVREIFTFLGLSGKELETCCRVAKRHDINRWSDDVIEGSTHVSSKNILDKWREYFEPEHIDYIKFLFGDDVLERLGYS